MSVIEQEPEAKVDRHSNVRIPYDGETISATRYAPVGIDQPLPTIFMSIPYRKDDMITYARHEDLLQYLAVQGYQVVVADMIGTGASTGRMKQPYLSTDGEEQRAVIKWICRQEWSNERVGMIGHSYGGQTALRAANSEIAELEAIVTVQPAISHYEDLYYKGGLYTSRTLPYWFTNYQVLPPSFQDTEGEWAKIWESRLDNATSTEPYLFSIRDHETKDNFWQEKDIPTLDISTPLLMIGSYRDVHPRCDIECFQNANGPKRMLLGPWYHELPHKSEYSPIDFRLRAAEWFDHFLKDVDNGAFDCPPISYYTERGVNNHAEAGTWRGTKVWPDVNQMMENTIEFALTPAALKPVGEYDSDSLERDYEIDHTVGIFSSDYLVNEPVDPTPDDTRSLVFETKPLTEAIEFTGSGHASLTISANIRNPAVAVRVTDIDPNGDAILVTQGHLRASHRNSHENPDYLEPGSEYQLEIPLRPKSHLFESGHQIRVSVSGAAFPIAFPTREHGTITVHSTPDNPSLIRIPGCFHDSNVQFDDRTEVSPPQKSIIPSTSEYIRNSSSNWETTRNLSNDAASLTRTNSKTFELPHGGTIKREKEFVASVAASDPSSAKIKHVDAITLMQDSGVTNCRTTVRFTHDTAQIHTVITIDDQEVFNESWTHNSPIDQIPTE